MAVYNAWVIEYKNGSTWTAIDNVQDLSCQVGRQTAVDQWPVSQASIRVWYPEGYASPLANLNVGTYIRFFAPGRSSTKPSWTGLVKNVTLEVGIPWNSGLSDGNADFLTIDCEGALSQCGQTEKEVRPIILALGVVDMVGFVSALNYRNILSARNTTFDTVFDSQFSSTQNFYELTQKVLTYSQFRAADGVAKQSGWTTGTDGDPGIYFGLPTSSVVSVGFSDTANNSTNRQYDEITFDGLADMFITEAVLTGTSASPDVTYSASNGTGPFRRYQSQMVSGTYGQSVADWYVNAFGTASIEIAAISATTANQHTQNLDTLGVTDLELGYLPFYVVPVTLRGTTFYCQIEGVAITADTNQTRFTYYVTPSDTTGWFILDSSTFGVLDQNRLGIY